MPLNGLTIAVTYHDNPHMLGEQQRVIETYPEDIRKAVKLVVADDASIQGAAEAAKSPNGYTLEVYRIKPPHIPWSHKCARNLAMHFANEGWCLAIDIDHILPAASIETLWGKTLDPFDFYIPGRQQPDGSWYPPHPNSYILTKRFFWSTVGGCNEDFRGFYGTDGIFRRRAQNFGNRVALNDVPLVVYNLGGRDIGGIPGAATDLPRKDSVYHARTHPEMRERVLGAWRDRPIDPLRFEWERTL